jgi:hypothetical protein
VLEVVRLDHGPHPFIDVKAQNGGTRRFDLDTTPDGDIYRVDEVVVRLERDNIDSFTSWINSYGFSVKH